jgi:signal peptidase
MPNKKKVKTIWEMIDWKKISLKKINQKKINYWKIISTIIYIIVIVFAITAILSRFSIGGIKLLTVQSGSMEPAIKTGSVVFVKSENNYQKGIIITYRKAGSLKETITHRIVGIQTKDSTIYFQTKGDANNAPDSQFVPKDWVVGKVLFGIPYIGYPIAFVRTLPGLIILIIIPATIIIYDEISKIKRELVHRKYVKRKKINKKKAKKGK